MNDLISHSVILLPFIFLLLINIPPLKNGIYLYGLLGYILTLITTDILKNKVFYNNVRPRGAYNCNIFNSDKNQEGKPGFPSGHVSSTSFFVSFFIYIIFYKTTLNTGYKIILSSLLMIYLLLVGFSRYYKKCHTINQIIGGAIYGFIIFILILSLYQLFKR